MIHAPEPVLEPSGACIPGYDCLSNSKRPVIVYLNPEQDRKAAVINPSGFKNFWSGKNSGVQCEIIRTKKRKKSKKNKNSDGPSANSDQEGFDSSLHSDSSLINHPIITR